MSVDSSMMLRIIDKKIVLGSLQTKMVVVWDKKRLICKFLGRVFGYFLVYC